jgi:hypothetical protein
VVRRFLGTSTADNTHSPPAISAKRQYYAYRLNGSMRVAEKEEERGEGEA